jgi:hypothetical protein
MNEKEDEDLEKQGIWIKYSDEPPIPRSCIDCGMIHDTVIENTREGIILERLDKCRRCMFKGLMEQANARMSENLTNKLPNQ